MPDLLAAVSFEASNPLPRSGSFRKRGLARRQPRAPESLVITAGETRAPRWLILDELSALRVSSSRDVRVTGTRE
jgi:hypothetical protein